MNDPVAIARTWCGTPYLHQASVKGAGCDCLGLIRGIWRELGLPEPAAVPAYTADWDEPQGQERLRDAASLYLLPAREAALAAGEVLLFRMRARAVAKHLGLVAGTGKRPTFIHAYAGRGVVESPLSDPWRRRIAARFVFPKG